MKWHVHAIDNSCLIRSDGTSTFYESYQQCQTNPVPCSHDAVLLGICDQSELGQILTMGEIISRTGQKGNIAAIFDDTPETWCRFLRAKGGSCGTFDTTPGDWYTGQQGDKCMCRDYGDDGGEQYTDNGYLVGGGIATIQDFPFRRFDNTPVNHPYGGSRRFREWRQYIGLNDICTEDLPVFEGTSDHPYIDSHPDAFTMWTYAGPSPQNDPPIDATYWNMTGGSIHDGDYPSVARPSGNVISYGTDPDIGHFRDSNNYDHQDCVVSNPFGYSLNFYGGGLDSLSCEKDSRNGNNQGGADEGGSRGAICMLLTGPPHSTGCDGLGWRRRLEAEESNATLLAEMKGCLKEPQIMEITEKVRKVALKALDEGLSLMARPGEDVTRIGTHKLPPGVTRRINMTEDERLASKRERSRQRSIMMNWMQAVDMYNSLIRSGNISYNGSVHNKGVPSAWVDGETGWLLPPWNTTSEYPSFLESHRRELLTRAPGGVTGSITDVMPTSKMLFVADLSGDGGSDLVVHSPGKDAGSCSMRCRTPCLIVTAVGSVADHTHPTRRRSSGSFRL